MYSEYPFSAAPFSSIADDDIVLPMPVPEPEPVEEVDGVGDPITSGPWVRKG